MENTIEATIHLTEKDYLRYNFYSTFRRPVIRILLGLSILYFMYSLLDVSFGDAVINNSLVTILLAIAAYWILVPSLIYFRSVRNYKVIGFKVGEVQYTFTPEGYSNKTKVGATQVSWNAIYKVQETKSWFLIFHSPFMANIIMKRDLSHQQQADLKQLLQGLTLMRKKLL